MLKSVKFIISIISLALLLGVGIALAQEGTSTVDVTQEVNADEDIQAQDLGVGEPNILPDSPFYFFKEWGRGIQSFFTFNPIAKARLKEKFANEKLIEVKKMIEEKKAQKRVERAIENYQKGIEEVKKATDRIKEKAKENVKVGDFLDKFIQHQALHQRLLQRLETQVPPEAFEKIKVARERHLERFGEVMNKLEDRKEKLRERLEKNLEEIKGSEFKGFKNLEILKELEEKVPEEAKEAIRKARESSLLKLKEKLEKMPSENQERFKEYIEKISGAKEKQMEILENLKEELKEKPEIREKLLQSREKILGEIRERVQERIQTKGCPEIEKPAPDFCQEGRILIKKDERGCIVKFKCVIPAETEAKPETILPQKPGELPAPKAVCITLWDPVCGDNGKTYSNECWAKVAGVDIEYKGVCKEKEVEQQSPEIKGPFKTPPAEFIPGGQMKEILPEHE
jgi:hypothetical protein